MDTRPIPTGVWPRDLHDPMWPYAFNCNYFSSVTITQIYKESKRSLGVQTSREFGSPRVVLHTNLFVPESSPTLTRTRLDGSKLY
jgi:hypothetical protein